MELKHTPGPWHYEKRCIGSFLVGADGNIIAGGDPSEGYMDGSNPDERLIAAAPDLLEAAKLVLEWYEAEDNHSGTDFYQRIQMCRDSEDAIRAAIAKATGQKS